MLFRNQVTGGQLEGYLRFGPLVTAIIIIISFDCQGGNKSGIFLAWHALVWLRHCFIHLQVSVISPKTPSAFAGRRLSLSCTLVGNITNDISSRDIVFESTNDDVMSKAVKRVIDDRTVSLDIWRAYLNMSSSRISCNLGNLTLDEVAIVVG